MASTIAPTEEEKRDLYNLANNIPFDDRINHEASLEELAAYAETLGAPELPGSGKQERLENIVNNILFG